MCVCTGFHAAVDASKAGCGDTELMEKMHSGENTLLLCDSLYLMVVAEGRLTVSLACLPTNDKLSS